MLEITDLELKGLVEPLETELRCMSLQDSGCLFRGLYLDCVVHCHKPLSFVSVCEMLSEHLSNCLPTNALMTEFAQFHPHFIIVKWKF